MPPRFGSGSAGLRIVTVTWVAPILLLLLVYSAASTTALGVTVCASSFRFPISSLANGVAHAQQARAGSGAVVHHVEPVLVAQVTCFGPLVVAYLDAAAAGAALDLDTTAFAGGADGEQVEARPVGQPGPPSLGRSRHVLHLGPGACFECGRDTHCDGFHFGVVARLLSGIVGGNDEGVEQELRLAGADRVGVFVQLCQAPGAGGRELALAFLHAGQLGLRVADTAARLRGEPGARGGQFGGLEVEAAADELDAGGQLLNVPPPMGDRELLCHFLARVVGRGSDHPARAAGERRPTRREVCSAAQQQQALDGRLLHGTVG